MRRPYAHSSGLLAALVLLAAPACWAVTLTRGPYLTLQTRNSITVVWNTDIAANCGLSIGPTGGGTTVLVGPALTTLCAVTAGGLTPGATYSYVPQANGVALRSASTFRADHPGAPFRFGVVGDTGTGSSGQTAVRDRMLAGGLDLLVHTGDMVYEHGELADQDPMFFTPYKDLIRQLVFWPVMGNHDYEDAETWSQVHFTPANNAAHDDTYYSFDRGNAHFVVIDSDQSTSRGSPQYVFLEQDLAASTAQWKFVFFHHAFYVSSGSSSNLRSNLAPLFDTYRVDIAFMGHVHVYERSKPLRGGSVVAPGAGTVYVTTGGGGAPLTSASSSSTTAYGESANHYTRVSIDGGTLALEMIRRDGVVRDTMTLVKGAAGSTTTTTTIVTTTTSTTTSTTLPPGTSGVDVRVSAGSDDAEEDAAGAVSLTSSDIELTRDSTDQTVGIRFRSVAIPPGATIQRAWVQLSVDEASSDATALTIAGEDVDNSVTFTTGAFSISSRSRTPQTVAWSPSSWQAVGQAGTAQRTPDVTAIVQRIVSRSGWRSGNALSVIITGTGRRIAAAFEGSSTGAALLHVEYGAAVAITSTTSTTTTTLLPTTTVPPPTTSTTTTTSPAPSTTTTTISTPPIGTSTVEARVASGSDDAEEDTQGRVALTSSDLELTVDSSAQTVGVRFTGLAIPTGATIQRAWVQLTVDEATSEATALTIAGENVDTSATFTTVTRNVSNRTRTPETVTWSPAAWPTVGQAGTTQRTPDLTAIVQRIVSRADWRSGNALSVIITGTGRRVAVAFEAASTGAALLHVEYGTAATTSTTATSTTTLVPTTIVTTSTTTTTLAPTTTTTLPITAGTVDARVAASSDDAEEDTAGKVSLASSDLELTVDSTAQTIGVRFRGLTIPRGAQVLSAWVQFKADKATSDATSLTIAGEAADSAATFTTVTRNASGRARTTASVAWTPAVWPTAQAAGTAQRTPDLAAVVQQIVARPGWTSGNALVLLVTGTGKRVAVSFDAEAAGAPLLHVEYGPPPTTTTTSTSTTTTSSTTSTTEPSTTTTTLEPTTTTTTEPTTTTTTEPTTSTTEPSTTTTTTEPPTTSTPEPTTTTTTEPTTSTTESSTTTTTTEPPADLETTTTTEVVSTTTTTEPAP